MKSITSGMIFLLIALVVVRELCKALHNSLESFQVIQSRGMQNQTTEYHDKIVELVNQNVHLIQNRMIV